MRWRRNPDEHRKAADTNTSFDMLFLYVRNGYAIGSNIEANQIQKLTGTPVMMLHIVQMAKEIVAIQNGVVQQ